MNVDIAAIREILKQYAMNISNDDFDSWISLWADDGTALPPDAPVCVGKEQIRRAVEPEFDAFSMQMDIVNIEDSRVYGELGFTRCKNILKVTPKAGGETVNAMPDGKALTLYKRQSDDSWKIIYDCYNSSVQENPPSGIALP